MDVVLLKQALDETAAELRATAREFERLQANRIRLEAVVSSLTALLSASTEPIEAALEIDIEEAPGQPKPTWMMAREVFPPEGGTMSVPQIAKIINANGVVRNPDAIRIAMRRRPDIFEARDGGLFALKTTLNGGMASKEAQKATEIAF